MLDPVLGGLGPLTARVLDENGGPLAGVQVKLTGVGALPLTAVTDLLGQAVFLASPLTGSVAQASVGTLQSNPVLIGPFD